MAMSQLDYAQVIRTAFDDAAGALKVEAVSGSLVPDQYDSIELTYVVAGNGVGEIETATYKLDGSAIATLTLTYDGSNRLSSVVRS